MTYENLKKILFKFDPEFVHSVAEFGLRAACAAGFGRRMLARSFRAPAAPHGVDLSQSLLGARYDNPIGVGGGFDKNATMIAPLHALGFGFVEVGTFTPRAQSGNAKPRLFRLISERSIQNAMGFNNHGAEVVARNVARALPAALPVWANIGKNKITPNDAALADYETLARRFDGLCDAFVVNISSPNTPGLRALQDEGFVAEAFGALSRIATKPLALKIAPDIEPAKAVALTRAAVAHGAKILVCNNTSVDYSLTPNARDFGGLSGEVIKRKSRELFDAVAAEVFGECVLVSCGGIADAAEAYERVKMGANLVEIFTAFIFEGPSLCRRVCEGLAELVARDGLTALREAVGVYRA